MPHVESVYESLEVQHHRISSQVSLIAHLRNDGRYRESENECKRLEKMLDKQTELYEELWDAQDGDSREA
jgi:hypothetical protein